MIFERTVLSLIVFSFSAPLAGLSLKILAPLGPLAYINYIIYIC